MKRLLGPKVLLGFFSQDNKNGTSTLISCCFWKYKVWRERMKANTLFRSKFNLASHILRHRDHSFLMQRNQSLSFANWFRIREVFLDVAT